MPEAIAGLVAIALAVLKFYLADKAKREAKTYANDTATFDQALHERDADRLTVLFDELRAPAEPGGGDTGGQDDHAAAQRQL